MSRRALIFAVCMILAGLGPSLTESDAFAKPTSMISQKQDPQQIASQILDRLDAAWTAGDGAAFAAEFTDDADVVNIFGAFPRSRGACQTYAVHLRRTVQRQQT
jgi:hypothetical protein